MSQTVPKPTCTKCGGRVFRQEGECQECVFCGRCRSHPPTPAAHWNPEAATITPQPLPPAVDPDEDAEQIPLFQLQ